MNSILITGIDLGSRTTKICVLEDDRITYKVIFPTGHDPLTKIHEELKKLPETPIMATGYGRHLICREFPRTQKMTEIKACAIGAHKLHPECRIILDVGGQDCKVIESGEGGRINDFEMNDRCAAGTGKFIEVMADTLHVTLDDFIGMALEAKRSVKISSMCTVFAESEVVSLITSGNPREGIALGLHEAIAERLYSMISRFHISGDIIFVGGGAKNQCLVNLLRKKTGRKITVPENPQLIAAFGAAL